MPGSDEKKLKKAPTLKVDCAVLDLEDGVAFSQKDAARENVLSALEVRSILLIVPTGSDRIRI